MDIEKIFNAIRPNYPIRKYVDVFGKISKNFKEDILKLNKLGYFDEDFEEISIDDICKKVGVDKKDIDEIIEKTKFEVEGAVYYRNGERFFVRGKEDKVGIKASELYLISNFIHSHPKGTSFSMKDIELIIENEIPHITAFNDEYFYSLKIEDFNKLKNIEKIIQNEADLVYNMLYKKFERGEISYSQLLFAINHKIWKNVSKKLKEFMYEYYRIKKF